MNNAKEHSDGTVTGGDAKCPYPGCGRIVDGDEVKRQAQAGGMGEQLYAVVFKRKIVDEDQDRQGQDEVGARLPRPGPRTTTPTFIQTAARREAAGMGGERIVPTEAIPGPDELRTRPSHVRDDHVARSVLATPAARPRH